MQRHKMSRWRWNRSRRVEGFVGGSRILSEKKTTMDIALSCTGTERISSLYFYFVPSFRMKKFYHLPCMFNAMQRYRPGTRKIESRLLMCTQKIRSLIIEQPTILKASMMRTRWFRSKLFFCSKEIFLQSR